MHLSGSDTDRTQSKRRRPVAVLLLLFACGGEDAVRPTDPTEPSKPWLAPADLVVVSGDGQRGLAGARLPEPFVIQITNARGEGIASAQVAWSVTSGAGRVDPYPETGSADDAGFARAWFEPTVLGPSEVSARAISVAGSFDETVTFTAMAEGIQVELQVGDFGWGNFGFYAPDESNRVIVPAGTPVEWVNQEDELHTVTSTSVPPGGAAFDSGMLRPSQRFRFVPRVPGTWEYVDEVSGATGTLTVEVGG